MLTAMLHHLDPEQAHRLAIRGLSLGLLPKRSRTSWPRLRTSLAGLDLPHPLGLAAGFDKNAEALRGLAKAGFGWLEVGTITPRSQAGNPKPRIFRLASSKALINRLGFNNQGLKAARRRLALRRPEDGIVGANIGANRDAEDPVRDYGTCLEGLYALADYFTINVSSPNTPGLRDLQGKERLTRLLCSLAERRERLASEQAARKPLFLKIAPDLAPDDEADIAAVALAQGIDGLIIANTTLDRPDELLDSARHETGGLSGPPLFQRSTAQIRRFHRLLDGRLPLIGVGGIDSGERAYAKIKAGASALQIYTGFVYGGPGLLPTILDDLERRLEVDGFSSLGEAVGSGTESGGDKPSAELPLTPTTAGA